MTYGAALRQERLDVAVKERANYFNWRGQFTPQLVEYLLEAFAPRGASVLDPFCGSGTVLQESARRNLDSLGLEINPAAYAMSKFFSYCRLSRGAREKLIAGIERLLLDILPPESDLSLFSSPATHRQHFASLYDIARALIPRCSNKAERHLAFLLFAHAESATRGPASLRAGLLDASARLRRQLLGLPQTTARVAAHLCDARSSELHARDSVDLVITSPPYINVFNYHQNFRGLLEVFGFDLLRVAQSEVGSNRKNRSNRYRTVVQYTLDLDLVLRSLSLCLRPGGRLVVVIGRESRVRGVPFANSRILEDLIFATECFEPPQSRQRSFVNRFGESIIEDIVIATRTSAHPGATDPRAIAVAHLNNAAASVTGTIHSEISDAIAAAPSITPSPLFDPTEII